MFTAEEVQDLPSTVKYFDRYPTCIAEGQDGRPKEVTPDFVVVFQDESVLIGEIAVISQHENSVDKLCNQLLSYDRITSVSIGGGHRIQPTRLDVIWLVPSHMQNNACKRVLEDRYTRADHAYSPARPPCIVQYHRGTDRYAFSRIPHPLNGQLVSGLASCQIGTYLNGDLNIKPDRFVSIKTERAFMNDAAVPLYLATYLYLRIWPVMFGGGGGDERTTSQEVAQELQRTYGYGRAKEVAAALELLSSAGMARKQKDGQWIVKRKLLGVRGDRETHEKLLELIESGSEKQERPSRKRTQPIYTGQGALFDFQDA
jgi:hypothetical protein